MSATGRSRHHRRDGRGTAAHQQLLAQEAQAASETAPGSYNDRENERARQMRTFLRACEHCGAAIYEDPGSCVQCAWDGPEAER